MKINGKIIRLSLFFTLLLTGCEHKRESLSLIKEMEIKRAWYEVRMPNSEVPSDEDLNELIDIETYYGYYNGLDVIYIRGLVGCFQAVFVEMIGDFKFIYRDSMMNHVYDKGEFYYLHKAYNDGLLTAENIEVIHEIHKAANVVLYDLDAEQPFDVNFTP